MHYFKCLIKTIAISLFASTCFAGDIVTSYLVWSDSFTPAQRNAMLNYGDRYNRQPAQITKLVPYDFNPSLFRLEITTRTNAENTAILNLIGQGKIQKLYSFEIIPDGMYPRVGNIAQYMPEPQPYSVEITTP